MGKLTEYQSSLIEKDIRIAYYMASKDYYKFGKYPYQDYLDASIDGMIEAAQKFDASKKMKFSSYAGIVCRRENWKMNRDRNVQKRKGHIVSIEKQVSKGGEKILTIEDVLGTEDEYPIIENDFISKAMDTLDEKEKRYIYLRYYEDMNQTEIAKVDGCYQMNVSRILRSGLEKLKRYCEQVG